MPARFITPWSRFRRARPGAFIPLGDPGERQAGIRYVILDDVIRLCLPAVFTPLGYEIQSMALP